MFPSVHCSRQHAMLLLMFSHPYPISPIFLGILSPSSSNHPPSDAQPLIFRLNLAAASNLYLYSKLRFKKFFWWGLSPRSWAPHYILLWNVRIVGRSIHEDPISNHLSPSLIIHGRYSTARRHSASPFQFSPLPAPLLTFKYAGSQGHFHPGAADGRLRLRRRQLSLVPRFPLSHTLLTLKHFNLTWQAWRGIYGRTRLLYWYSCWYNLIPLWSLISSILNFPLIWMEVWGIRENFFFNMQPAWKNLSRWHKHVMST